MNKKIFEKLRNEGMLTPYDNQFETASEILKNFARKNRHVILQGKTQSGKTGVWVSIVNWSNFLYKRILGINTMYFITGDDSANMHRQLDKSMDSARYNEDTLTIHSMKRSELKRDVEKDKEHIINNAIIFIDESHYGTNEDGLDPDTKKAANKVNEWLQAYNLDLTDNEENLAKKNVYIVSCSATPWTEIFNDEARKKPIVILQTSENYIGLKDFILNYQLRNADKLDDIVCEQYCEEWYEYLKDIQDKTNVKKCVIARIRGKAKIKGYKPIFKKHFKIIIINSKNGHINYSDMENDIKNYTGEKCHTIPTNKYLLIIVEGGLNMSVRIDEDVKKYIAICYDYVSTLKNIQATTQGLLGRMCGYRESEDWKTTRFYLRPEHIDSLVDYEINHTEVPNAIKTNKKELIKKTVYTLEKVEGNKKWKRCFVRLDDLNPEENAYNCYNAQKYFESKTGTNFNGKENFKLEDLNNKNIKGYVEEFLKNNDCFFDDAVLVETRCKNEKTYSTSKQIFDNYYKNKIYGGLGYKSVIKNYDIGTKVYNIVLDIMDINNIRIEVVKGVIGYEQEIEVESNSVIYKTKNFYPNKHAFKTV